MSIQIMITGDNVATVGKLAAELASKLNGSASVVAAPAASTPAPKPAAAAPAAAKPAAKPAPAAAKPAAKPAPAADEGAAASGITLESLREQGKAAIKAGKNKEMRELLTSLGSDSITALPEDKYAELDAGLKALLGGGTAEESAL